MSAVLSHWPARFLDRSLTRPRLAPLFGRFRFARVLATWQRIMLSVGVPQPGLTIPMAACGGVVDPDAQKGSCSLDEKDAFEVMQQAFFMFQVIVREGAGQSARRRVTDSGGRVLSEAVWRGRDRHIHGQAHLLGILAP